MSTMLSEHFSLAGMVATQQRDWVDTNAAWGNAHVANLKRLCVELLEPAREILGNHAMIVSSGIRCPGLNTAVGSGPASAHIPGFAADFICPDFGPPFEVCRALMVALPARRVVFDQLIYEHTWVHLALVQPSSGAQRGQVLTLMGPNSYAPGIILRGAAA